MFAMSHVNLLHMHIQKMITDAAHLSVVYERIVRFLTTVDVVLEEYDNCLPNNK